MWEAFAEFLVVSPGTDMAVTEWSPFEQDAKVPVVAPGVTTAAAPVGDTDEGHAVRFSVASLVRFRGGTLRGTPARVGPT